MKRLTMAFIKHSSQNSLDILLKFSLFSKFNSHFFIRRSQQQNRREIRMAYITFAIVALFFCLNMPRMILGSYEVSNTWLILRCVENKVKYLSTLEFYKWDSISRLLMVINSSINFLIYCMGSEQFKVSTKYMVKFKMRYFFIIEMQFNSTEKNVPF